MMWSRRCRILASAAVVSGAPLCGCSRGQIPGVGDALKNVTENLPAGVVPRPSDPITTSLRDAVTEMPLLDGFEPADVRSLADLQPDSGGFLLAPGAFAMDAQSYCLHAGSYAPARGDGYLYAPLAGPGAAVIGHILQRSVAHRDIPQHSIQVLIWSILAHAKIEQLSADERRVAAQLLTPLEIATLNRSALDLVPQSAWAAAEANMPPLVRDAFEAENRLRDLVTNASATYDQLEAVAVRAGAAPLGPGSRAIPSGRWSYHPAGFFVRYRPTGYSITHVEVYVPARILIQRDALGRITAIADRAGNRIETEYDETIPPLVVPGDDGIRGYAFKVIRFVGVDSSVPAGVREAEVRDDGWTFVGVPNGQGRLGALWRRGPPSLFRYASAVGRSRAGRLQRQDKFDQWKERYKDAKEARDKIKDAYDTYEEAKKEAERRNEPRSEKDIEDLTDLDHYNKGLNSATKVTDLKGKAEWIAQHTSMWQRAWNYVSCRLAGGCDDDQLKPFDPSKDVAEPGNTANQRLAQSARRTP